MKKKFLFFVLILLSAQNIFSQDTMENIYPANITEVENPADLYSSFSIYKPNYLIFGNREDQVKVQLSLKIELVKDFGFFFGYSQVMFWMLYDKSGPFSDINFNPELFWNYGNNIKFIRLGLHEHKSNGKDSESSRGWNRSYIQFQISKGDSFNTGFDIKGFYIWNKDEYNNDIADYTGYYEAKVFFRFLKSGLLSITDMEELYFRGGTGRADYGFDYKRGWIEAGLEFRLMFRSIQPHFFIQGFYGYGESLIEYNQKEKALRAGLIL